MLVISHVYISTCTIVNSSRMVARSFRQEAIQEMYKLPVPQRKLDQYFVNKFEAKELEVKLTTLPEVIEEW